MLGYIFFDMDETLGFFRNYDGSMDSEGFPKGIYLRHNVKEMLKKLNNDFLLFVTTAATVSYTRVVLEHADLAKYFHGIYTRTDFVKLENEGDANKEASPGGYEKRYSLIMKHFDIKMEQSNYGLVIGDNDYDTSCDVPGLKTLIVDSLFIDSELLYSIIIDIFKNNPLKKYEELGIRAFEKTQKHPIVDLESDNFELECLVDFKPVELDEVPVELTEKEKEIMKVTPEEEKVIIDGRQYLEEAEIVEELKPEIDKFENNINDESNQQTIVNKSYVNNKESTIKSLNNDILPDGGKVDYKTSKKKRKKRFIIF